METQTKNNNRLFWLPLVLVLIALVCAACEKEPDDVIYVTREIWNGMELRQYRDVTDNQYQITVNKFKTVFNSDSFTDEERDKLKKYVGTVDISYMNGGWGGGWYFGIDSDDNKFILSVPCDSIQSGIEKTIRGVLEGIGWYFEGYNENE